MGQCKDCIFFNKARFVSRAKQLRPNTTPENHADLGMCDKQLYSSDFWALATPIIEKDKVELTRYDVYMREDFGCIHFQLK